MCYDQEKTQAVPDRRAREVEEKRASADRFNEIRGTLGCAMSQQEIPGELFRYHPPTEEQLPKYAAIDQAAKNFAEVVLQNCPGSRDRSRVIELIQDARMTANRSIALNGLSL